MKHFLFICSENRFRSPTAEKIFSGHPGIEVASAGLNPDAVTPLSADLLTWADVVFVMEESHLHKLTQEFKAFLTTQEVVCLDIPDVFEYMNLVLIQLLKTKVSPFLARLGEGPA